MGLQRAGEADAERVRRKLQRPLARRMPQRASVHQPGRSSPDHRRMEDRLQHEQTAHEPRRAHTDRVRSTPQGGAKLEQILLMNEGMLGSRSVAYIDDARDEIDLIEARLKVREQLPLDDRDPDKNYKI